MFQISEKRPFEKYSYKESSNKVQIALLKSVHVHVKKQFDKVRNSQKSKTFILWKQHEHINRSRTFSEKWRHSPIMTILWHFIQYFTDWLTY